MSRKTAAILMATFNGQEYIKEQIDSIISQTYEDWDLYIRDDGSKDETLNIIKEYEKQDSRIHILSYPSKNHGACLNFYHLLRAAKTVVPVHDFYFLSDQDDIWENNKIELEIQACDVGGTPYVLVYSDLSLMSTDGSIFNGRMSDYQDINLRNPNDIFFNQIFVWGNTICINRALLEFMNIPDDISNSLSHDHYLAFYAVAYGKAIYIDKPLVRYRRHEDNVSGLPARYNFFSAAKRMFKKKDEIIIGHAQNYNNVLYFIKHAPNRTAVMDDIYSALLNGGNRALHIIKKYNINPVCNYYNSLINMFILHSRIYIQYMKK